MCAQRKGRDEAEKPHYYAHRKRLRERFLKGGGDAFSDYELVELLLTYAGPRIDVKPVAKGVIKKFGGISGVLDAGHTDLLDVDGMGPESAVLVSLIKEICVAYLSEKVEGKDALSCPQAVADFARLKLGGLPYEAFMVVFLNVKNEVVNHQVIQEGTVDRAVVFPRQIIEVALANHASAMILIHNHPSGHPNPSVEDRRLTRTITEAARTVDIRVLDHLVVGKQGYFSFQENHIMPEPA